MDESTPMLLKAVLVWLGIAGAETVNGIIRVRLLNRRFGVRGARQLGVLTGSVIIFVIGWFTVLWIGPPRSMESLLVGACWLLLMLAFDFGIGVLVFGASWRRIATDFDLSKGNLLGIGMAVLFLTPLVVAKLRGLH